MTARYMPSRIFRCRFVFPALNVPAYWLVFMGAKDSTATPAMQRVTTGMSSSARQIYEKSQSASAANENRNSRIAHTTANAPTRESFRIFCRVPRSRRDKIASQQSRNPSRWKKPVTRNGSAVKHAAAKSPVNRKCAKRAAHSAQSPPTISPTGGRHTICHGRSASSQTLYGHGIARYVPHAIISAVRGFLILVFIGQNLLCTNMPARSKVPRRFRTLRPARGQAQPVPGDSILSTRHTARHRRK